MYLKTEGRPSLTEKQKKYENFGRKKLKSNVICQLQNGWKRIKTWMIKLFTKLIEITQKKLTNGKHEGSPSICSLAFLKVRGEISSIFSNFFSIFTM